MFTQQDRASATPTDIKPGQNLPASQTLVMDDLLRPAGNSPHYNGFSSTLLYSPGRHMVWVMSHREMDVQQPDRLNADIGY